MNATLLDTAMDTGRRIYSRTASARRAADILEAPCLLETTATAGLIITMGMALTPGTRPGLGIHRKKNAVKRLRQLAGDRSVPRPRPVHNMAAELLEAIDTRGKGSLTGALEHQARMCRDHGPETTATALERIAPMREEHSAFHTSAPAAALMAHLCVPDNLDWADPATLRELAFADYACGHGALLTAVYRRARELHRQAGGNPAALHSHMMQRRITGTDISLAATAVAAENLAALQPDRSFANTRIARLPAGTGNGGADPPMGALDLLLDNELNPQAIALDGQASPLPKEAWAPGSQSIVVMNPPFASNPPGTGEKARHKLRRIADACRSAIPTGPAQPLALLALRNTAPGGTVGLILPMTAASGTTSPPGQQQRRNPGWTTFRDRLMEECADITVITSASYSNDGNSFSHDTGVAEAMITAVKLRDAQAPPRTICFVNIDRMPATAHEAASLAERIRAAKRTMQPGDAQRLSPGPGPGGHLHSRHLPQGQPWNGARKLHPDTLIYSDAIAEGRTGSGPQLPMTTLGQLARVTHYQKANTPPEDSSEPGKTGGPMVLKGHDGTKDNRLTGRRPAPAPQQQTGDPARLMISINMRANSQPTPACILPEPAIAGKGWAGAATRNPDYEKPLALWLNTTMGLMTHWAACAQTQNGRSYATLNTVKGLPVPDLRKLRQDQIDRLNRIFDDHAHRELKPAAEAWQDPVRQNLDQLVLETLTSGEGTPSPALALAQAQWCLEPTVQGRKGTTKHNLARMTSLRAKAQEARQALATPTVRVHQECLAATIAGKEDNVCQYCAPLMPSGNGNEV